MLCWAGLGLCPRPSHQIAIRSPGHLHVCTPSLAANPPRPSPLTRPAQELIFVGVNMDGAAITSLLDGCLLKDSEWEQYRKREYEMGKD